MEEKKIYSMIKIQQLYARMKSKQMHTGTDKIQISSKHTLGQIYEKVQFREFPLRHKQSFFIMQVP